MPDGTGSVRLRHNPGFCLRAVALHGVARLHTCGDVPSGENWYVRPKSEATTQPSLYCVAVMQPWGYERDIFERQLHLIPAKKQDIGVFDCNGFSLFSRQAVNVGWHHRHGWVHAHVFPQASVGVSKDGTAGNAELFMNMWDSVKRLGYYKQHDWLVKSDPDCVLIPDRLRGILRPKTNGAMTFMQNCNAWPGQVDYPMMYGALEVLSRSAMMRYFGGGEWQCRGMDWHPLGEDLFMQRCMQSLGIGGQLDPSIVGDGLCGGVACNVWKAAYHPMKSADAWMGCWNAAVR